MSGDGLMGRAELERAFTALGDRLVRRGVVADLFIVGGAAMALAYDAARVTRDVDATFVPHGVVLEEARTVAEVMGLPPWWLNEQASAYVSANTTPASGRYSTIQASGSWRPLRNTYSRCDAQVAAERAECPKGSSRDNWMSA
ncbi:MULTISPECIES: hypothetical protein [unclassified Actinoplanes]|uniref:hypothetical protein n=1 Tax=unclassified Actinoplanes TaxID=2626549 RepID=UPI0012BAD7F5|nr:MULTISPECIES: hypothetical protein [unclassified Actinoplanes]